jgi:transcriptional regulator of arginine metabolism
MPTHPEVWQKRQAAIRELLAKAPIASQDELLRKLAARGFRATQSSVSRDLREMHVAKADGRYVLPEAIVTNGAMPPKAGGAIALVRGVKTAGPNIVLIQTSPGSASAVGLLIDGAHWPEVVGTVAGDDTLLVATENRSHQSRLLARLSALGHRKVASHP